MPSPANKQLPFRGAERETYTIAEFCEAYRVHRATVWRMIKAGELRSFTIGRRVLIPVEAAEALKVTGAGLSEGFESAKKKTTLGPLTHEDIDALVGIASTVRASLHRKLDALITDLDGANHAEH